MKKMIALVLMAFAGNAQEHNIWYFGSRAGLDFNQGAPVAIGGGKTLASEGTATIADGNGNLLFYTDGITVWNKDHGVMENGNGLHGHNSSTQSALVIPKPGSNTIYFVFTTTAVGGPNGLCYTVVDMESDAGLGAVIEKNTLLYAPSSEKLAATWHSNGNDIWVMGHEFGNNVFTAYRVTAAGIDPDPITSSTGVTVEADGAGHIKFSPNGKRLAMTSRGKATQLFDFDPETGSVQNPVSLSVDNYGVEFSASGNLLYVSTNTSQEISLHQYDLQDPDSMATATELLSLGNTGTRIGALQRGPDNRIYVARHQATALSVINFPDSQGMDCGFTENSVNLLNGTMASCQLGLPNNTLSPAYRVVIGMQISCLHQESLFEVTSPHGLPDTALWEFGDGTVATGHNVAHTYLQPGNYTVRLTATLQGMTRVVETDITVSGNIPVGQPAAMWACAEADGSALFDLAAQDALVLGNEDPDAYTVTYHATLEEAESGANNLPMQYVAATSPQTLYGRMEAKGSGCFATTSFELMVEPRPAINMQDRYTFCTGNELVLAAPGEFDSYLWSTGATSQAITISQAGTYTLTVAKGQLLCENTKTFTVEEAGPPVIGQIKISDWTTDQNTITVVATGTGDYEYSVDGVHYQESPIFSGLQSGSYSVHVKDRNNCGTAIREVVVMMYPKFFTPNNDGSNDRWAISYSAQEPEMVVRIFDRYGKLLVALTGNSPGWDGTLGGRNLPATDYWFSVERLDGRQFKGHFALIR